MLEGCLLLFILGFACFSFECGIWFFSKGFCFWAEDGYGRGLLKILVFLLRFSMYEYVVFCPLYEFSRQKLPSPLIVLRFIGL